MAQVLLLKIMDYIRIIVMAWLERLLGLFEGMKKTIVKSKDLTPKKIFSDDIGELGPAILAAKQVLLANGSSEYEQISETFLLFGDPALALKIPLPRMPTGVKANRENNGVRIKWNAALDSNGNAVAGYHVYRASSPAGPYSRINTALVTGTEFVDTSGAVVGAGSGTGGGTYYYGVTSEDDDGDESAQSLGISPATMASSGGGGLGGSLAGGDGGGGNAVTAAGTGGDAGDPGIDSGGGGGGGGYAAVLRSATYLLQAGGAGYGGQFYLSNRVTTNQSKKA